MSTVEIKFNFDYYEDREEMSDLMNHREFKNGVGDWMEEVRAELKYNDNLTEAEYAILDKWRGRFVELTRTP